MEVVKDMLEVAACEALHEAAETRAIPFHKGYVHHAIDIDPSCRRVLASSPDPPLHVFGDILDILQPEIKVKVLRVVEAHDQLLRPMVEEYKKKKIPEQPGNVRVNRGYGISDRKDMKDAIKDLGSRLLDDLMQCMDEHPNLFVTEAHCHRHNALCRVFPPRGEDALLHKGKSATLQLPGLQALRRPLRLKTAGTSCKDWSSMGAVLSLAGRSVIPFAVELQMVKREQPDVWFHECTRNFQPSILASYLSENYVLHTSIQRPTERGFPAHRTRVYSALIHKESLVCYMTCVLKCWHYFLIPFFRQGL